MLVKTQSKTRLEIFHEFLLDLKVLFKEPKHQGKHISWGALNTGGLSHFCLVFILAGFNASTHSSLLLSAFRYSVAVEVESKKVRRRRQMVPRSPYKKSYDVDDLIYFTKSPDYCSYDLKFGSQGTRGR